jgi:hypothetical protein
MTNEHTKEKATGSVPVASLRPCERCQLVQTFVTDASASERDL